MDVDYVVKQILALPELDPRLLTYNSNSLFSQDGLLHTTCISAILSYRIYSLSDLLQLGEISVVNDPGQPFEALWEDKRNQDLS